MKSCSYLGTEKNGKWHSHHIEEGFIAIGQGAYWLDADFLYFKRSGNDNSIRIPLRSIKEIVIGKWHTGQWYFGTPVVKVIWSKGEDLLSSGFIFARKKFETEISKAEIVNAVKKAAGGYRA